jgi:hypothetical protein
VADKGLEEELFFLKAKSLKLIPLVKDPMPFLLLKAQGLKLYTSW